MKKVLISLARVHLFGDMARFTFYITTVHKFTVTLFGAMFNARVIPTTAAQLRARVGRVLRGGGVALATPRSDNSQRVVWLTIAR